MSTSFFCRGSDSVKLQALLYISHYFFETKHSENALNSSPSPMIDELSLRSSARRLLFLSASVLFNLPKQFSSSRVSCNVQSGSICFFVRYVTSALSIRREFFFRRACPVLFNQAGRVFSFVAQRIFYANHLSVHICFIRQEESSKVSLKRIVNRWICLNYCISIR